MTRTTIPAGRILLATAMLVFPLGPMPAGTAVPEEQPASATLDPVVPVNHDELARHVADTLEGPRAQLLILGTFHFDDAGLDRHPLGDGGARAAESVGDHRCGRDVDRYGARRARKR